MFLPLAVQPLAPQTPNVVLFLCDDLGEREIGPYGQSRIPTPHLDALAKSGAVLDGFRSASPVCAPTRYSLLTGKHQGRAAIRGNKEVGGWELNTGEGQMALPASDLTLPEALQRAGYRTGGFGKWGLGGPFPGGHPLEHGFDRFFGYLCQRQAHNFYPTHLWSDHNVHILEQNRHFKAHQKIAAAPSDWSIYSGGQYSADVILDQAVSWINQKSTKPFFLYYPTTLPHAAIQAPTADVNRFPREWDTAPYLGQNGYLPNERPRAAYAAMIAKIDDAVGRIRAELKRLGQLENTLFIFTSDNGPAPNGGVDRDFFGSTGPYRGMKTQIWEGGLRVPLIASWPNRISPRRLKQDGVSYDLFSTILQAAKVTAPLQDGVSLLPALQSGTAIPRPFLYWEFPEGQQSQAILLDGRWKAVRSRLKQSDAIELYDLKNDPGEKDNVAAENNSICERAVREMKRLHVRNPDFLLARIDQP